MRRALPWWVILYLQVGVAEAAAIGISGFLSPSGYFFRNVMPLPMSPLNGRVIGAMYIAGAVGLLLSIYTRTPHDVRIFVVGFGLIAGTLLLMTLAYWSAFTVQRIPYGWLGTYALDPVLALVILAALRLWRPARPGRHRLSGVFWAQAAILLGVGLVLLLFPDAASRVWPWKFTPVLARTYACFFVGFGVGALLAASEARPQAVRPFILASLTLCGLVLVASLVQLSRFTAGLLTWLWFGTFALGLIAFALVVVREYARPLAVLPSAAPDAATARD